jgi:hypothetical protein
MFPVWECSVRETIVRLPLFGLRDLRLKKSPELRCFIFHRIYYVCTFSRTTGMALNDDIFNAGKSGRMRKLEKKGKDLIGKVEAGQPPGLPRFPKSVLFIKANLS